MSAESFDENTSKKGIGTASVFFISLLAYIAMSVILLGWSKFDGLTPVKIFIRSVVLYGVQFFVFVIPPIAIALVLTLFPKLTNNLSVSAAIRNGLLCGILFAAIGLYLGWYGTHSLRQELEYSKKQEVSNTLRSVISEFENQVPLRVGDNLDLIGVREESGNLYFSYQFNRALDASEKSRIVATVKPLTVAWFCNDPQTAVLRREAADSRFYVEYLTEYRSVVSSFSVSAADC